MPSIADLDTLILFMDRDNKCIVADALEESGRYGEADLLRSHFASAVVPWWWKGHYHAALSPSKLVMSTPCNLMDTRDQEWSHLVVTEPQQFDWPDAGVCDLVTAKDWAGWTERVHFASCRLTYLGFLHGEDWGERAQRTWVEVTRDRTFLAERLEYQALQHLWDLDMSPFQRRGIYQLYARLGDTRYAITETGFGTWAYLWLKDTLPYHLAGNYPAGLGHEWEQEQGIAYFAYHSSVMRQAFWHVRKYAPHVVAVDICRTMLEHCHEAQEWLRSLAAGPPQVK